MPYPKHHKLEINLTFIAEQKSDVDGSTLDLATKAAAGQIVMVGLKDSPVENRPLQAAVGAILANQDFAAFNMPDPRTFETDPEILQAVEQLSQIERMGSVPFDEGLARLQGLIGVTDGDFAGAFFSAAHWQSNDQAGRLSTLQVYIKVEETEAIF